MGDVPNLPSGHTSTSVQVHATGTSDPSQLTNRMETHDRTLGKSCRLPARFVQSATTLDYSIPWHASNTASLMGQPNKRCVKHLHPAACMKFLDFCATNRATLGMSIPFCACKQHENSQATPNNADGCPVAPTKATCVLLG